MLRVCLLLSLMLSMNWSYAESSDKQIKGLGKTIGRIIVSYPSEIDRLWGEWMPNGNPDPARPTYEENYTNKPHKLGLKIKSVKGSLYDLEFTNPEEDSTVKVRGLMTALASPFEDTSWFIFSSEKANYEPNIVDSFDENMVFIIWLSEDDNTLIMTSPNLDLEPGHGPMVLPDDSLKFRSMVTKFNFYFNEYARTEFELGKQYKEWAERGWLDENGEPTSDEIRNSGGWAQFQKKDKFVKEHLAVIFPPTKNRFHFHRSSGNTMYDQPEKCVGKINYDQGTYEAHVLVLEQLSVDNITGPSTSGRSSVENISGLFSGLYTATDTPNIEKLPGWSVRSDAECYEKASDYAEKKLRGHKR